VLASHIIREVLGGLRSKQTSLFMCSRPSGEGENSSRKPWEGEQVVPESEAPGGGGVQQLSPKGMDHRLFLGGGPWNAPDHRVR